MSRLCLRSTVVSAAFALCVLPSWPVSAQDSRQNEPGQFDFYLLTLSWSPSFCEASAERAGQASRNDQGAASQARARTQDQDAQPQSGDAGDQSRRSSRRSRNEQCGDRPYSFVVHGLWPQYERGFPEFCQTPAPRLNRNIVSSMLDLMPSPQLIFREWDRHDVLGLPARAYLTTPGAGV